MASLSWYVPGWVEGGFISSADIKYHVDYVKGAKLHHNLTLDFVGVFNERDLDPGLHRRTAGGAGCGGV